MSNWIRKSEVKGESVAKEITEHVRIDVGELEEIHRNQTYLKRVSSAVCIFEVPTCLKDLKADVYVPKVVGLGPLHHHHTLPRVNQLKKEAVLLTLLKIYPNDPLPNAMEKLKIEVMEMEKEIEDCYEMSFSFNPDIFILDSCFLVDFFFPRNDKTTASYSEIKRDLMKLENQIPLILLQRLLVLILQGHPDKNADDMIVKMARKLFGNFFVGVPLETSFRAFKKIEKKPRHLLEYGQQFVSGFVRDATALEGNNEQKKGRCARFSTKRSENNHTLWSFPAVWCALFNPRESEKNDTRDAETKDAATLQDRKDQNKVPNAGWRCLFNTQKSDNDDYLWSFPAAHDLEKAGFELKACEKLLFERKWWGLKGVLTIPRIIIADSTEVGLKNIIAFEDRLPQKERLVTGFMGFLDCLIDKDIDVGVLRRAKIIDNLLESDRAVANIVNSSCVNVVMADNLKCVKKRMKAYYSSKWRVMVEEYIATHLSKPWLFLGKVAAVLLLTLTIVQTIYTVKSYKAAE